MFIQKSNFKISIGSKDISITDKFVLINGKIKKSQLKKYLDNLFLEISENFNIIPIEKYIEFLREPFKKFHEFLKFKKLFYYIEEYHQRISNNTKFTSQYIDIIHNLNLILRNNLFLKKKDSLIKELEISNQIKKSSDIAASTDLLEKLNNSLTINKNKLELLQEDYLQRKNQVDRFKKEINNYDLKIQELNKQKKHCFSQINRITREMGGETIEPQKELQTDFNDSGIKITNAEKIKNYQKKAKEIQFDINKLKSKKSQTQLELEEELPLFEIYEKDYQSLLEMINNEEKRIIDIQSNLKNKILEEENQVSTNLDFTDFKSVRPTQDIRQDLERINVDLNKISISKEYIDPQNPHDFSQITKKLEELNEKIEELESEITITIDENEIYECLERIRILEKNINEIETIVNKFLSEITIKSQFGIIVNELDQNFYIEIKFIRNNTQEVNFDGLTTPEKIFFIIAFYLSNKLHIKEKNIIFSNVSILTKYNKAGSIYRAIRKILPIFEKDPNLSKFKLVFIISNLELKREIKNLTIKTIQEP